MTQTKTSVSHRVLLVDDDEAVRDMMSRTLECKGFEVVPAASVVEALKLMVNIYLTHANIERIVFL